MTAARLTFVMPVAVTLLRLVAEASSLRSLMVLVE